MQEEISARIQAQIDAVSIRVEVDGDRAVIEVVSDQFADMSRVKKQQTVYACIEDLIADGRLHAVTIRAEAPQQDG